jgi:hypothetical protein
MIIILYDNGERVPVEIPDVDAPLYVLAAAGLIVVIPDSEKG